MPLTLHVDAARWHDHLRRCFDDAAASGVTIVPVTKGNGYGFGNSVLAEQSAALAAPTLAVGTYDELAEVTGGFNGDVLVLSPWRPGHDDHDDHDDHVGDDRLVHTVSRLDDLRHLAGRDDNPRVVVELLTSMLRHGITTSELPEAAALLEGVRFEGFALHLPLTGDHGDEARSLATQAFAAAGERPRRLWVSHLAPSAAGALARDTSAEVRLRIATALWLGDRTSLRARATVLDAHPVRRGQAFGYRQRRARRDGTILVVSGGTAHGIALEAPTPASTVRQRAVALAKGTLESAGRALSPFRVSSRQRWFAEPPHMQCSMIWLPGPVEAPATGDVVDVDVRFTTTTFDQVIWEGGPAPW